MTNDELTDRWEAVLDRAITHEEHLRIAYTLIRRHGRAEARSRLVAGTLANCQALDAGERFDADLTARWSDRMASCVESDDDGGSFTALIERHPDLRASDLLGLPDWKRPGASSVD
jgi:hypothetical protein